MPVTKFMMDRVNRFAREAGKDEPYPYTEAGYKKFFDDFSKSSLMKAYIERQKLTKTPLEDRFKFDSKPSYKTSKKDWICLKSESSGFESYLFDDNQEQEEQEQKKPKGWLSSLFDSY